jgi:hypothetical protein
MVPSRCDHRAANLQNILGCAAFLLLGCGSLDPQDVHTQRSAIVGGIDSVAAQDSVVQLRQPRGLCSATLVAPNLVLTARHCVSAAPATVTNYQCDASGNPITPAGDPWPGADVFGSDLDAASITVLSGGQAPSAPVTLGTEPTAAHGLQIFHSADTHHCHTDLALVALDRGVDDPVLAPLRLDESVDAGDLLIVVGWGMTADAGLAETRQQRAVTVVHLGPAPADFPGDVNVMGGFFSVGESACVGDSGGAAMAPSGAVVGVASTLEKPNLFTITSGADCVGPQARVHFEALSTETAVIAAAFAAAGATPWREGTPDPRAPLSAFNATCAVDADCRSNVCLADLQGTLRCSTGCLGNQPCPPGFQCTESAGHARCVESLPTDAGMPVVVSPPRPAHCGCGGGEFLAPGALVAFFVTRSRRRR